MGHHYVPRRYLRAFEVPEKPGFLWMYDKESHRFIMTPIASVAQQRGFYDPETEEKLNVSVEGPAHSALDKLVRDEMLTTDDRRAVATYLAVMIMRVPAQRRRARDMFPSTVDEVVGKWRGMVEELANEPSTDPELVERRRSELEIVRIKFLNEPPDDVVSLMRSPWPSEGLVDAVDSMAWRLLRAPRNNPFVTSDNPAFHFESLGVGRVQSELSFPLTPSLALLANWQGPRGSIERLNPVPSIVKEINRRAVFGAERFIFSDSCRKWIGVLAASDNRRLARINWQS